MSFPGLDFQTGDAFGLRRLQKAAVQLCAATSGFHANNVSMRPRDGCKTWKFWLRRPVIVEAFRSIGPGDLSSLAEASQDLFSVGKVKTLTSWHLKE